jgi:hypothetical protein
LGAFLPTYWAIVYFGQYFENYRSSPIFTHFLQGKSYVLIKFDKKWVGLYFGRFFSQTHLVTLV